MAAIATNLQSTLRTQLFPLPSHAWLLSLATARTPPLPLASLMATARARILASDLTTPGLLDTAYTASHTLPAHIINNVDAVEHRLAHDVVVQVADIENLSRSRWEQVEELEAIERGEQTRGREVIRLPPVAAGDEDGGEGEVDVGSVATTQNLSSAPGGGGGGGGSVGKATHKLVLQDCKGQNVFAIELKRVEWIAVGKTNMGEKILLRKGTVIARGAVLLDPDRCHLMGGKIEAWHKGWIETRLARLKEAATVEE
ncbi:hypothetical protein B0T25DRAFT_583877 [Lasiosphaeria hispida]|uniref:RecQ mediated genome instability protein 1-like N-terminal helical domain-containing protein n=1 Tax=Lasiosphaeria hispida TaxID=260671 RepID=A0AAJ0MAX3_9PEZI|nr:hypothetical protein B0T25DRAFT_583877 [Lasiosphaeria hispida]